MLLNAYCTHRDPPPLAFTHVLRSRRDRRDPELAVHLRGFMGFVMGGGKRQMTQVRYHLLCHLQRVRHQVAVEVETSELEVFERWAVASNAIVFSPDGAVRTPMGQMLVDPTTGDAQPGAEVPYPEDAVHRKAATDRELAKLGVRVPGSLPPSVAEVEVELRAPREVGSRGLALFACALRAESLQSRAPLSTDEIRTRMPLAFEGMSPKERAFMGAATPAGQEVVSYAWRYESLATLAWALDRTSKLPFPARCCDVPTLARTIFEQQDTAFLDGARLRAPKELLDQLDLHFRLHWATTDARAKKAPVPSGLEPGVVLERHYALNWLTRFNDADWDDVETST